MRSYYSHLQTAANKTPALMQKPVMRASAIFPVMQTSGISTRLIFLGYWILKRHIHQIGAVTTLRSIEGKVLARNVFQIDQAKAFRIELSEELARAGLSPIDSFVGSLEVEFFSTVNLVFPYPAVTVNYYGKNFSSVVHTAQRVYNDPDDMRNNSQTHVPESGFNIHVDEQMEPFIGLINGPVEVPNAVLEMQFINHKGDLLKHKVELGKLTPYQTQFLYPARLVDLKKFLQGEAGSAKVSFNVNWIFPRLLVGNVHHASPAVTITHTYYDCTAAQSDSDYWLEPRPDWYVASLMVPLAAIGNEFTTLYFYPIYSPSRFAIDVEIFDDSGMLLGRKQNALIIESPGDHFQRIPLNALCKELDIDMPAKQALAARLIGRSIGDSRFPARVKLALDMGVSTQPHLPCNICMNLQPFNPGWDTKPTTFRWLPLLADQPKSAIWIMNSSPEIHFQKSADITISFFREQDTGIIVRNLSLPPNGFIVIHPEADHELSEFFEGEVGWCTVLSSNPYTTTYYFAMNPSGVYGGDHGY